MKEKNKNSEYLSDQTVWNATNRQDKGILIVFLWNGWMLHLEENKINMWKCDNWNVSSALHLYSHLDVDLLLETVRCVIEAWRVFDMTASCKSTQRVYTSFIRKSKMVTSVCTDRVLHWQGLFSTLERTCAVSNRVENPYKQSFGD